MWKPTFGAMVLSFLLVLGSACSSGGNPGSGSGADGSPNRNPGTKEPTKTQEASTAPERATITFFQTLNNRDQAWFDETYGNLIKKRFPHLTLEYIPLAEGSKLPDLLAAGKTIDMMIVPLSHTYSMFMQYELQSDISDLIKKNQYDLSRIEPTSIEVQRQLSGSNAIYGLPVSMTFAPLFYNKAIFDKFGVPYLRDGMIWDEVYEAARKLTRNEGGTQYRGMVLNTQLNVLKNQLSLSFIDPKTNKAFTDERWKGWTEFMSSFYKIPGNEVDHTTKAAAAQIKMWEKDQTVAIYNAPGNPNLVNWNFDWDMVAMPSFKEAPNVGPQATPLYVYIPKISKHRDQAFEIIEYMTSDEVQTLRSKQGTGTVLVNPEVHKVLARDVPGLAGKNIGALLPKKYAPPMNVSNYNLFGERRFIAAFESIVTGQKDVNTALREAAEWTEKDIEAQKKQQ